MRTCHRHYPGRFDGACSLVPLHHQRPSLCNSQVGSCHYCFGACSAFTHVMACTLAESLNDPFHRKLRQLRCLRCRFDCYRVERTSSRAGVAPAEVQRLSRRTVTTVMSCNLISGPLGTRYPNPERTGEASYGVISNTDPKVPPPSPLVTPYRRPYPSIVSPAGHAPGLSRKAWSTFSLHLPFGLRVSLNTTP